MGRVLMAQTWVLITGSLRNIPELYEALGKIFAWRESGLIDQIVLSTWHDQLHVGSSLTKRLEEAGVIVVQQNFVNDDNTAGQALSAWRQLRQLESGLKIIPPGTQIFKMRTDKSLPFVRLMEHLLGTQLPETPVDHPMRVFGHRLYGLYVKVGIPLHMNDVCLFGMQEDFQRLITYDGRLEALCFPQAYCAEVRWLTNLFLQSRSLLSDFVETTHIYWLQRAFSRWADAGGRTLLPDVLNRVLAWHHLFVEANLGVTDCVETNGELAFHQLFSARQTAASFPLYTGAGVLPVFSSDISFQRFMAGDILETAAGREYLKVRGIVRAQGLTPVGGGPAMTAEQWAELAAFTTEFGEGPACRPLSRVSYPSSRPDPVARQRAVQTFSRRAALEHLAGELLVPAGDLGYLQELLAQAGEDAPLESAIQQIGLDYLAGGNGLAQDRPCALRCLRYCAQMRYPSAQVAYGAAMKDEWIDLPEDERAQIRFWLEDAGLRSRAMTVSADDVVRQLDILEAAAL